MGNQANFCCDHDAQFKLFDSNKKPMLPNPQATTKKIEKQAFAVRNQRIFSRDDISIIDQLDIKSSLAKQDLFSIPTTRTTTSMFDKENVRPKSSNLQLTQRQQLTKQYQKLKRERQWYEHRIRELQQQKQKQAQFFKNQLQCEYRAKQSLKTKKRQKQPRTTVPQKPKQKQCDFQFIVNYR